MLGLPSTPPPEQPARVEPNLRRLRVEADSSSSDVPYPALNGPLECSFPVPNPGVGTRNGNPGIPAGAQPVTRAREEGAAGPAEEASQPREQRADPGHGFPRASAVTRGPAAMRARVARGGSGERRVADSTGLRQSARSAPPLVSPDASIELAGGDGSTSGGKSENGNGTSDWL